jgi:hypothetical protein
MTAIRTLYPKRIWTEEDRFQFKLHLLKVFVPKSSKPQKFIIQQTWDNLDRWGDNWHNKDRVQQYDDDGHKIGIAGTLSFLPRKYLRAFLRLIRHDELIIDESTGQISGKKKNKNGTCRKRRSNHLHTIKETLKFLVSRTNFDPNNSSLNYLQMRETSIDCIVKALGFSTTAVKKTLNLLSQCEFLITKRNKFVPTNTGLVREGIATRTFTKLFFQVFGLGNKINKDIKATKSKKKCYPKHSRAQNQDKDKKPENRKTSQDFLTKFGINKSESIINKSGNQQQKEQISQQRQSLMLKLIMAGVSHNEARERAYKEFPNA